MEEAQKLPGVTVVYFYCKYDESDRNTFLAVARGIILQLFNQDESLLPYLYEKASRSGQRPLSTNSLAKELLETAVKNYKKLYVVIDGIDECENKHRSDIVSTFRSLWESLPAGKVNSLRCLFVSQDDGAAREDFAGIDLLKITEIDTRHDIRVYTNAWSKTIGMRFDLSQDKQQLVEDVVTQKAEGRHSTPRFSLL